MPADPTTRWFRDSNGRISQINRVILITFGTPLIANNYYRDEPPIVVGGAAVLLNSITGPTSLGSAGIAVSGGDTQTITDPTNNAIQIKAPSSVLQSDSYTHTDLRFIWAPVPLVFFQTSDALAANPTDSSFSKTRPVTNFDTFDVDCVFAWGDDCAIFNSPPPGWSPGNVS